VSSGDAIALVVLAVAGLIAGFMNAVAGAGSLLTLPALIFTGLDASAANATNRVAVLAQSVTSVIAYRRGGVHPPRGSLVVLLVAALASALGAWVATLLEERAMRIAIAVAMFVFAALSLVPPKKVETEEGAPPPPLPLWSIASFLAIGFYAGFLQAGVGILVLLYTSLAHGMSLVIANSLKVMAVTIFTIAAIAIFAWQGETIDLLRGAVLGLTTSIGGWLGARATIERGERFVRYAVIASVLLSAGKLVWDLFFAS
jgi:uncharacterized membrane protein YfcA